MATRGVFLKRQDCPQFWGQRRVFHAKARFALFSVVLAVTPKGTCPCIALIMTTPGVNTPPPKVSVDSLVAKYNAALKKATDSSTRLQRLLVVAETLLPQLKRKDPQVAKEFSAAVSNSRALMLESLEKTADLKSLSKDRDGEEALETAVETLTKVTKECNEHQSALQAAMTEHKKTVGQAEADGSEPGKAASSGGHLAIVDIKQPAASPKDGVP